MMRPRRQRRRSRTMLLIRRHSTRNSRASARNSNCRVACGTSLPAFDRAVWNLDERGRNACSALAVANANLRDDLVELLSGLEGAQTIFQILGDTQPRSVPAGELAEQQTTVVAVLFGHQREVPQKKLDLFFRGRPERFVITLCRAI